MAALKFQRFPLIASLLCGLVTCVYSQRDIPTNNLSLPVLVSLTGSGASGSATGFFTNANDTALYFVTAKHVLLSPTENKLIYKIATLLFYSITDSTRGRFRLELDLPRSMKDGYFLYHKKFDVALIKVALFVQAQGSSIRKLVFLKHIKVLEKPNLPLIANRISDVQKFDEVLISNEVIIFGYPRSLGIKQLPQIDYDRPLLRKGIIAGKNDKQRTIILDCPVYKGNSGGPAIALIRDGFRVKFRLIGVVSQTIPFVETWVNQTQGYVNIEISNSGYSVIIPMDAVLEVLKNEK